jgi:chromate reductase
MGQVRMLAIAGSLRSASFNRGLVRAAVDVAPSEVNLEPFDIASIPLYDGDLEAQGDPPGVAELKARVQASDAVLVATPEYNYSIPGVLKNALDWASRPPQRALHHKPIALIGASPGGFGTVRSQLALRQMFVFTESYVMPKPELWVSRARERFDDDGNLTDDDVRKDLASLLEAFAAFARRVGSKER